MMLDKVGRMLGNELEGIGEDVAQALEMILKRLSKIESMVNIRVLLEKNPDFWKIIFQKF